MLFMRTGERNVGQCLLALVTIGSIDRHIVLLPKSFFVSLVFIIGIVTIRFVVAVMFQWFFSWKLGNFMRETYEQCMQRSAEIENLFSNIYHPTRSRYCPRIGKDGLRKRKIARYSLPILLRSYSQRLSSKDRMDDERHHMACSISRSIPIGSTQPCMGIHTFRLTVFEKQCPYLVVLLLIASASSLSSTSLSLRQNISSSVSPRSFNIFAHYLFRIVEDLCTAFDS